MKFISVIATLLFATNAFAYWSGSSWDKINSSNSHKVITPNINGGLFNLCLNEGGNFETKTKIPVCVKQEKYIVNPSDKPADQYWGTRCVSKVMKKVYTHRNYLSNDCVKWDVVGTARDGYTVCVDRKKQWKTWPLDYELEVQTESGDDGWRKSFTKSYSIPDCQ